MIFGQEQLSFCTLSSTCISSLIIGTIYVFSPPHLFLQCEGQILNRFTKDLGQIDDFLPGTMWDFLEVRKLNSQSLHGFAWLVLLFSNEAVQFQLWI